MLDNMKISTRLTILLAFLLAGLVVIGGVGLYASGKLNGAMKSVYEDRVMPITQLNTIYTANLGNRLAISNALNHPEDMAEYIQAIADNKTVIDKQWEIFTAAILGNGLADEEDKNLTAKFTEVRGRFVEQGIKPVVAAMRANNLAEIKRIQAAYIAPLTLPLNESLDALIDMQKRDAQKAYEESNITFQQHAFGVYRADFARRGIGRRTGVFHHSWHQSLGERAAWRDGKNVGGWRLGRTRQGVRAG